MLMIDPCCYAPPATNKTFTGCSGLVLANYQIRIRSSSGGTILETFTTDASGVAGITSTGTKWVESTDGRFSGQSVSLASATIALWTSFQGGVGASYFCANCCAIPWQRTMTFTSGYFGSATFDQSATSPYQGWSLAPACYHATCPTPITVGGGVNNAGSIGGNCTVSIAWGSSLVGAVTCASSVGVGSCIVITYITSSMTCPPGGTISGSASVAASGVNTCTNQVLCNSGGTWNDTMTASE